MAKITETELRKKLKKGGRGSVSAVRAVKIGETWENSEEVLYLAYASALTNVSYSGIIPTLSDCEGFTYDAFNSAGVLYPWRGYLFSKSLFASGDPTDYIWEEIADTSGASTMERSYTTHSGLLAAIGNPDFPGTKRDGTSVPWIEIDPSLPIPDEAYSVAERYTFNKVTSPWNVYTITTDEVGFGLIPYAIPERDRPELNSDQWNDDAILAASSYTGKAYTSVREIGFGSTVVITYRDGKLYGMVKKVGGLAVWVAPVNYIDGALLVESSIISKKIADSAITTDKILKDAINSDKIAANAVNTTEIAAGAITANEIQAKTIGAEQIAANAITAGEIAAKAITATEIAAGTITASQIKANTISANEIEALSITAEVLAANAVTADKVKANSITASLLRIEGVDPISPSTIGAPTTGDLDTTNGNVVAAQETADSKVLPSGVAEAINGNVTTIDGAKITTGTISAESIDVSQLKVQDQQLSGRLDVGSDQGSIAWGKTGGADINTTGLFLGNSGGSPFFNVGDSSSYIQYSNNKLFVVGAIFTGSSAEGAVEEYRMPFQVERFNIPPTASEVRVDLAGAGGGGAGLNTGNSAQRSLRVANIHGIQFGIYNDDWWGIYYYGPDQGRTGESGGRTVVKLYNSSGKLLTTLAAEGGKGGSPKSGAGGGSTEWVRVSSNFPAVTHTDPQGEDFYSPVWEGKGGQSWDFSSNTYGACGGGYLKYYTCDPTRLASNGSGVGSGGGGGGYQLTEKTGGWGLKGFCYGGKRGEQYSEVIDLIAMGAGAGSYFTIEVGGYGTGGGNHQTIADEVSNGLDAREVSYMCVSRKGASGANGAARITVTGA